MYAGLQRAEECWCGDYYGSWGDQNDLFCFMDCPGDDMQKCGGETGKSVYRSKQTTAANMKCVASPILTTFCNLVIAHLKLYSYFTRAAIMIGIYK